VGQLGTFAVVVATRVAVGFYAGAELWWWLLVSGMVIDWPTSIREGKGRRWALSSW